MEPPSYRDCAVVYVISKQSYAEETLASAGTVRRAMPGVAIYLKAGREVITTAGQWQVFDHILYVDGMTDSNIRKCCFLDDVAEGKVLYLDSDTYVVSGLRAAFDLLGKFDIACAHAPFRLGASGMETLPGISSAFCELNAGVIFCRNSGKVRDLLRTWRETYEILNGGTKSAPDQPAFRSAVWNSNVSLYVLPPEYNARLCFPAFLSGEARILHCRFVDMAQVAERVNADLHLRTFLPEEFGIRDRPAATL